MRFEQTPRLPAQRSFGANGRMTNEGLNTEVTVEAIRERNQLLARSYAGEKLTDEEQEKAHRTFSRPSVCSTGRWLTPPRKARRWSP